MTIDWKTTYNKRKVLLTGHSGFKGVWLTTFLKILGADVIGLSRVPDGKLFQLIGEKRETIYCDICDAEAVHQVVNDAEPEIIFHLAAQAIVGNAYNYPRETFEINTQGTINVLDAVRFAPTVKAVIAVTTDKVYRESNDRCAFVETDELGGADPYSASKAAAEIAINAYRDSFFKNTEKLIASARAGNVIGGGDWAENRLIPDFVRAIQSGTSIVLRNPHHVRPWQHVLEPIRGYLMLGHKLLQGENSFAEAWNFGPSLEDALSVKSVAEKTVRLWGKGHIETTNVKQGPRENPFLSVDSTKAHKRLNWYPALDLEDALRYTVNWYRSYVENGEPASLLVNKQINDFLGLLAR